MTTFRSSVLVLALYALAGQLSSAELVVRDAHLALELLPSDFEYEMESGTSSGSSDDSFDRHLGLAAGVLYSFSGPGDSHGILVGGELAAAQAAYGSIGNLTSFTLRGQAGYGWAISDRWQVYGLVELDYGVSTFDITQNSAFTAVSSDGAHFGYGAAGVVQYSFNDLLHLSLKAGWQEVEYDLSGSGVDLTLTNSGLMVGLGISYRLSNTPRPLE
jgi:hypothetical protein